ncbi:hypothetical protein N826_08435 [Skermanella aerolata KACC 11604]|nr:hypothetical protein N826_08435 [Skermanella aerolata KACC 11604]
MVSFLQNANTILDDVRNINIQSGRHFRMAMQLLFPRYIWTTIRHTLLIR